MVALPTVYQISTPHNKTKVKKKTFSVYHLELSILWGVLHIEASFYKNSTPHTYSISIIVLIKHTISERRRESERNFRKWNLMWGWVGIFGGIYQTFISLCVRHTQCSVDCVWLYFVNEVFQITANSLVTINALKDYEFNLLSLEVRCPSLTWY